MTVPAPINALEDAGSTERFEIGPVVEIINGRSIVPMPIVWQWQGYLAAGKLHFIAGKAATGKTSIALALAATLTTGGRWPDGTLASCGDVLVWSGEDDNADTLLPRFLASGGDRSRIYFIKGTKKAGKRRPFDPSRDIPELIEAARRLPLIRLLILDPVVSAIAGDSHKNAEVRRSLQPLVDFAAEAGAAVLGLTHFTKRATGRDPIDRMAGSLAFGAVARLLMATEKSAGGGGKHRLVRVKSNIGPAGGGFEYELAQGPLAGFEFAAQRAIWGEPLEGDAGELLNGSKQAEEDPARSARSEAEAFLRKILAGGPLPVRELKAAAAADCVAWRTVERAKKLLRILAYKDGMEAGWKWRFPDTESGEELRTPPKASGDRQEELLAAFGGSGGLRNAQSDDAHERG